MRQRDRFALLVAVVSVGGCFDFQTKGRTPAGVDGPSTPTTTFSVGEILKSGILAASADPDFVAPTGTLYKYTPVASTSEVTYTISNKPDWAQFDTTSGTLSGTPTDEARSVGIVISASSSAGPGSVGPFEIDSAADPLMPYSWALENTGQSAFALNRGIPGQDIKALEVQRLGFLGDGMLVVVSDTGIENTHPDLVNSLLPGASRNYKLSPPYSGDPGPDPDPTSGGDHGTSVSGIIAAEGWNGIGTRGVAPKAKLAVYNYLAAQPSTKAIDLDQLIEPSAAVFNQSYGYDSLQFVPMDPDYEAQLLFGVTNYRSGSGAVYVKAAGNDYDVLVFDSMSGKYIDTQRALASTSEEDNNVPYVIVVGAVNAKGMHSSYSSPGSNLWISAPGGEFGYADPSLASNVADNPAIITTDLTGTDQGYAKSSSSINTFESCHLPNVLGNYTSIFNGTSSATPHTSGSIAVLLAANPNLTWRDVKHILAVTADQIDPSIAPIPGVKGASLITGYTAIPAWTRNAAGNVFHNLYGFGRLNLKAALTLARNYTSNLGMYQETTNPDGSWMFQSAPGVKQIPDGSSTGVTSTINVTSDLTIETVQIAVDISHSYNGDLGIELTAPSGTVSVLLQANNALEDSNLNGKLLSNAFYGESSQGVWTIKVLDGRTDSNPPSGQTLNQWQINIAGH